MVKTKPKNSIRFLEEEVIIGTVAAMDRAPVNMAKPFRNFCPRVTGRKRWEVKENNSKKADESKQLGTKVETDQSQSSHTQNARQIPVSLAKSP